MANITAPVQYIFPNVTADDFLNTMYGSQAASWLTSSQWPNLKAYDVVLKLAGFFDGIQNASLPESQTALVAFAGTTQHNLDDVLSWYGSGETFAALMQQARDIVPLFGHPAASSGLYVGLYVFLTILVITALSLRIYSRLSIFGFIRAYDWVLLAGAITAIGYCMMNAITLSGPTHYRGLWDRSWNDVEANNISGIVTDILYPLIIFLVKTSLLLFYWTLTSWAPLRSATGVIFVVTLLNSLAMIFLFIFECMPVLYWRGDAFWTANCKINRTENAEIITGGVNIAVDLAMWMIPLPMVWKITRSARERLFTCVTFGVGAIACIACGIRLSTIKRLYATTNPVPPDQTPYLLWSMVEVYLAIICSCVPALRALAIKKLPSLIGSSGRDSQDSVKGSDDGKSAETETVDHRKSKSTSYVRTDSVA